MSGSQPNEVNEPAISPNVKNKTCKHGTSEDAWPSSSYHHSSCSFLRFAFHLKYQIRCQTQQLAQTWDGPYIITRQLK